MSTVYQSAPKLRGTSLHYIPVSVSPESSQGSVSVLAGDAVISRLNGDFPWASPKAGPGRSSWLPLEQVIRETEMDTAAF